MGAITQYTHDRASAVQAVLAGNDLLCCSTYERQVPAVLDAIADGTIPLARIEQSVRGLPADRKPRTEKNRIPPGHVPPGGILFCICGAYSPSSPVLLS